MSTKTKERIYLVITVICLLMCAVLLLSVFLDRPVFGVQAANHIPVLRPITTAEPVAGGSGEGEEALSPNGLVLTEKDLAVALQESLPKSLPISDVEADIEPNGRVCLSMDVMRKDFEAYLKKAGVTLSFRQRLAIKLLPKKFEFEACTMIAAANGNITVTPLSVSVNDGMVSFNSLPAGILDVLNAGLNTALGTVGDFTTIVFTDDSIILQ